MLGLRKMIGWWSRDGSCLEALWVCNGPIMGRRRSNGPISRRKWVELRHSMMELSVGVIGHGFERRERNVLGLNNGFVVRGTAGAFY